MRSDRLEDANYCILGTLFRTKNESYETLLSHVVMNTSKHRRYYQALVLIYKCLNSTGPKPYIAEFLSIRDVCYNLGGKGSNLFFSLISAMSGGINPFLSVLANYGINFHSILENPKILRCLNRPFKVLTWNIYTRFCLVQV